MSEPTDLLGDIIAIMASDLATLKKQSVSRIMTSEEALTLKRYGDLLLEWQREKRKVEDEEVDKMTQEELVEAARKFVVNRGKP